MNLRDVLQQHRERTGDSYRKMAEKCGLSHAKVGQLMADPMKHRPHPETLNAVAAGLDIPPATLRRAVRASLGEAGGGSRRDQTLEMIDHHLTHLSDDTLVMAEAVLSAMVKVEQGD